jgi:hypothetical protein
LLEDFEVDDIKKLLDLQFDENFKKKLYGK